MSEKKLVPAIRFRGFTDAWGQHRLSDFLQLSEDPVMVNPFPARLLTVKLALKGVVPLSTKKVLSIGSTVYYSRRAGDFIYGKQNLFNGSFGIIPEPLDGFGSSRDVPSFRIGQGLVGEFLVQMLSIDYKSLERYSNGTGSKRVHEKEFLGFEFEFPIANEQRKIAQLHQLLESSVALRQRKLDKLRELKNALLERMFPREGEDRPRIRFKGFTDAWGQCPIRDFSRKYWLGGTPNTDVSSFWGNGLPWIQSSDLQEGVLDAPTARRQISKEGITHSSASIVSEGSVAIVIRVGVGKVAYIPFSYCSSQDFLNIKPSSINAEFFALRLLVTMKWKSRSTQGSSIQGVSVNDVLSTVISAPLDSAEQYHVAKVYNAIEKTIALRQRKPFR